MGRGPCKSARSSPLPRSVLESAVRAWSARQSETFDRTIDCRVGVVPGGLRPQRVRSIHRHSHGARHPVSGPLAIRPPEHDAGVTNLLPPGELRQSCEHPILRIRSGLWADRVIGQYLDPYTRWVRHSCAKVGGTHAASQKRKACARQTRSCISISLRNPTNPGERRVSR